MGQACRHSSDRGHINAALRSWHDAAWLQTMRLNWVSKSGEGRNTPHAGRLGTRMYGGQPQPRWGEGVLLAEQLDSVREISHFGNARLSIATRIREAQCFLRQFFADP